MIMFINLSSISNHLFRGIDFNDNQGPSRVPYSH